MDISVKAIRPETWHLGLSGMVRDEAPLAERHMPN
jgi:hypothetical protein